MFNKAILLIISALFISIAANVYLAAVSTVSGSDNVKSQGVISTHGKSDSENVSKKENITEQKDIQNQILVISGNFIKYIGVIVSILIPMILFVLGYQVFRSFQFESEWKEIRKLMNEEYNKIVQLRTDSERFVSETKEKLNNIQEFIGQLATNFLREKVSEIVTETKKETGKIFSEIKTSVEDEKKRNLELMKKLETLDLTLTPDIYNERGTIYLDQGYIDKAIENFNKAIELRSDDFNAFFNKGIAYFKKDNFDQSLSNFLRASEIKPNNEVALVNVGVCYMRKNDVENALKYVNKSIELNPRYGFGHYIKSQINIDMEKYDLALDAVKEALKTEPNNPDYLTRLGFIYAKQRDFKSVIKFFENIKIERLYIYAILNLAEAYICEKEYEKAEKTAARCFSLSVSIREKICSKYMFLIAIILNNKDYKIELKSFLDLFTKGISEFRIEDWSFEEITFCMEDPQIKEEHRNLVYKLIGMLKGEVKPENINC